MLVRLLRAHLLQAKHIGVERRQERQQRGAPARESRLRVAPIRDFRD